MLWLLDHRLLRRVLLLGDILAPTQGYVEPLGRLSGTSESRMAGLNSHHVLDLLPDPASEEAALLH